MKKDKFYYFIIIFLVGAFIGWIYESALYTYYDKTFVNSGTLYGPIIPIYGYGTVLIYLLKPLKKHPLLLFIGSFIICGLVEFIIGYIAVHAFDLRLWDYSSEFLNIEGIVCLKTTTAFGLAGLLFTYLLEPFILKIYNKINKKYIKIFCYIVIVLFIIDNIISIIFRTPKTF